MGTYTDLQNEVIAKYRIVNDVNSSCWGRTHAHIKARKVCKWKSANSFESTFELLHEVGHIETTTSKMRRCEEEYYATVWAIERCKEYGLSIKQRTINAYQDYIYMEYDRGLRRGGQLPNRENFNLNNVL